MKTFIKKSPAHYKFEKDKCKGCSKPLRSIMDCKVNCEVYRGVPFPDCPECGSSLIKDITDDDTACHGRSTYKCISCGYKNNIPTPK